MKYLILLLLAWMGHWNICETCIQKSLPRYSGRDASPFSIIIIPDTQIYSWMYDSLFYMQTDWIVKSIDSLNIQFVLHVGDIVQNCDADSEWQIADSAMGMLDGVVDYMVVEGNHDYRCGKFESYFPNSRFDTCSFWVDSLDNHNYYGVKTIYDRNFLFLGLEYCPVDTVLDWADSILTLYSEDYAIVWTHSYLHSNGSRTWYCSGLDTAINKCGEYMWENCFKNHDNIVLIACGHIHAFAHRVDTINGNPINQTLQDWQADSLGGYAFLSVYKFYPSRNNIHVQTYSPFADSFMVGANYDFWLKDHREH